MKKLTTLLQWLDQHILKILVIGFIFIIPLYPKLPLQMINYTYVALRLEDIYIAFVGLVFGIQFLRKKVTLPKKFVWLIGIYWIIVFISYLWGYFVQGTIAVHHLGLLHSLRRVEYMLIFFVVFTTIKSKEDFFLYIKLIFSVLCIVSMYGIGQKFFGWPAVQTMNPEYAKGYILILDSWARISSTFAGHYDLSAYLLLLMPIILGFYMYSKNRIYIAIFTLALATLILAGSRASYLSYIGAIGLFLLYTRKWQLLLFVVIITAILTPLSDNLTERLTRTFQETKIFVDPQTGEAIIPGESKPDELPRGNFGANVNTNNLPTTNQVEVDPQTEKLAKEQIRDSIIKEAQKKGQTLTEAEIRALVEQTFGEQVAISKYLIDISLSTRFQVAWPRAVAAFIKNPLLGLGPSALGEATDGDYFRWIGETGLLGTVAFIAIFFELVKTMWDKLKNMTQNNRYIFLGFLFGFLGLFVNASYIDVFEASKVAYTFWLLAGIFIAAVPFFSTNQEKKAKVNSK
ncbi:MAG TPA: O-antigen ligase family protein [Candidatus Woesebacteria bacterium]|nr:O-antigen ligase family protein [Candidatus Woesebacteria bacterium]